MKTKIDAKVNAKLTAKVRTRQNKQNNQQQTGATLTCCLPPRRRQPLVQYTLSVLVLCLYLSDE